MCIESVGPECLREVYLQCHGQYKLKTLFSQFPTTFSRNYQRTPLLPIEALRHKLYYL